MKKSFVLYLLVACLLIVASACSTSTPSPTAEPTPDPMLTGGDRTVLLDDYPIDILPLYACEKVWLSDLTQYKEGDVPYLYGVAYAPHAAKEDVLSYYQSILEDPVQDGDALSGTIGERFVTVAYTEQEGEARIILSITGGAELPDEHPYFADFPAIFTFSEDDIQMVERTYSQSAGDTQRNEFRLLYNSMLSTDDLYKEYGRIAKGFDNYEASEEDGVVSIFFTDSGFDCWVVSREVDDPAGMVVIDATCIPVSE